MLKTFGKWIFVFLAMLFLCACSSNTNALPPVPDGEEYDPLRWARTVSSADVDRIKIDRTWGENETVTKRSRVADIVGLFQQTSGSYDPDGGYYYGGHTVFTVYMADGSTHIYTINAGENVNIDGSFYTVSEQWIEEAWETWSGLE